MVAEQCPAVSHMEFKDYYKVLGLNKTASAEEIKKSYRKLARQYHPDVNPGDASAEARFKELNEANEVLGDPDTRKKYDQLGANWRQYENMPPGAGGPFGGGGPFGFGGGPAGDVNWSVNVGGGPSGRTLSEDEVREMFGENPFSDFFQTFFAGGRQPSTRQRKPRKRRGRDLEHEIELALEQAYHGVTQRLSIRPAQGGSLRNVEVRIPAGVTDGSRVRVSGEGEAGTAGGSAGDLYLQVRLAPHETFECKGQNLYVTTTVPVTTAVLGGETDVPTLDGSALRLKVPAATQPGQVLRLKGKGMPGLGRRTRGDLYATVQVRIPGRLSAKAREHYEALVTLEPGSATKAQDKPKTKHPAV